MNYFIEGSVLLLNDFVDFCKHNDEDFDDQFIKSLIGQFTTKMMISSGSVFEVPSEISEKKVVAKKTKTLKSSATKSVSKEVEISVNGFKNLSIEEMKSTTWSNKTLVVTLKNLCKELKLPPVTKQTKSQIIEILINHKMSQENTDEKNLENNITQEPSVVEESLTTTKPRRRVISAAMRRPIITIIKKNNLNFVACEENNNIMFVLNESDHLIGYVATESYENCEDNGEPEVMSPTKDVFRLAKNMGIKYDIPEQLD